MPQRQEKTHAQTERQLVELLHRVGTHDRVAFNALYALLATRVRSQTRQFRLRTEDADEVANDVWRNLWLQARNYDESRGPVVPWILTVARNRALDRVRQLGSEGRVLSYDGGVSDYDSAAASDDDPAQEHAQSEQRQVVHDALAMLTTRRRTIVKMAFLEEKSHSEIAAQTQRPLGTIKATIRRALERMRESLSI